MAGKPDEPVQRLIQEQIKKRKLRGADSPALANGNALKIEMAQRLRGQTMVKVRWIAERLHMGSVPYVNNRSYLQRKGRLGKG